MARPVATVPIVIRALLMLGLCLQLGWSGLSPALTTTAQPLPAVPAAELLQLAAFGEPQTLARLLMLWLQAYDDQPGLSIPFAELDYTRLSNWLGRAAGPGPPFPIPRCWRPVVSTRKHRTPAAKDTCWHSYTGASWKTRTAAGPGWRMRFMSPGTVSTIRNWPLDYARALRLNVTSASVPPWVAQLELFVLEDLGEAQSARLLIGALLASNRLSGNELRFLQDRLATLERQPGQ